MKTIVADILYILFGLKVEPENEPVAVTVSLKYFPIDSREEAAAEYVH